MDKTKKTKISDIFNIENRAARHEYFIEDTLECGIALKGNEVKSIQHGRASIKEAWVDIVDGELILKQFHITKWETQSYDQIDPVRERVLLAHRREIDRLEKLVSRQGYTLVPLKVYFTARGKCKVLIGLGKGKKLYDKRESEKQASMNRDMRRAMKEANNR